MSNKVKLTIGGINYFITSEESEEYMQALGEEVDRKIKETGDSNIRLSTTMAAVLAALDFADERNAARREIDRVKQEMSSVNESLLSVRADLEESRREIERLSRENRQLRLGNKF